MKLLTSIIKIKKLKWKSPKLKANTNQLNHFQWDPFSSSSPLWAWVQTALRLSSTNTSTNSRYTRSICQKPSNTPREESKYLKNARLKNQVWFLRTWIKCEELMAQEDRKLLRVSRLDMPVSQKLGLPLIFKRKIWRR